MAHVAYGYGPSKLAKSKLDRSPRPGGGARLNILLAGVVAAFALAVAPAAADNIYYCGYYIYQGQCPYSVFSRDVNVNHAYVPGSRFGAVCERAYWTVNYTTVSRRCSSSGYVSSDYYFCNGDLWGWRGSPLELTVANNQSLAETVDGHTYVENVCV